MTFSVIIALCLLLSTSYINAIEFDFCVGDTSLPHGPSGYACKDPAKVTADDFVFSGLSIPGNTSNIFKFGASAAFVDQFLGLNGLGISMVRADLDVGGAVPIHSHRVAELVIVIEGTVINGFIDSKNKAYYKTLQKGDIMVVPPSLQHFQVNVGNTRALSYASFASPKPGYTAVSNVLFGSDLPSDVVEKVTLLDPEQVQKLKKVFGGTN